MATKKTVSFASKIARPAKLAIGRAPITETPLNVRATGTSIEEGLDEYARRKLGRKLRKFAQWIERATVRFKDVNGPKGGIDTIARIKVVLSSLPSVVVEERGIDARHAFDRASHDVERAVRHALGRAGFSAGRAAKPRPSPPARRPRPPNAPPPQGSLIGRRVGHSPDNLQRVHAWGQPPVDTSLPGVSATARKAGRGSTAARNVKLATSRATAMLEDSATGRPSRKSTRKSANRAKSGSQQSRLAKARTASPKQRALQQK